MSLNAIAIPAARAPGPLVILLRLRTVAKVLSIVILSRWQICLSDLAIRVVDGVLDAPVGAADSWLSMVALLSDRDVFGVGCHVVVRGPGRVGGVGAGSRRRVHGCGAARCRGVDAGRPRWRAAGPGSRWRVGAGCGRADAGSRL